MVTIHHIQAPAAEDISPCYDQEKRQWYAVTVKGAPDVVLRLCSHYQRMDDYTAPLDDELRQRILAATDAMTQDALRVIATAYRITPEPPDISHLEALESDLVFVGLVGMIDPPRPEAIPALKTARNAGIRTVMITGDYPKTAKAIAESIGLLEAGHRVLTGADLNAMEDEVLRQEAARTDVFARVSPEHKLRIVEALRANGQVVAMTGDGVNDAPTLAASDVGIALGALGSTAASESADLVIMLDDVSKVASAFEIAKNTIKIATQSIRLGIAFSVILMAIFASGKLMPIYGAVLQEFVDVFVIFNALRAHQIKVKETA